MLWPSFKEVACPTCGSSFSLGGEDRAEVVKRWQGVGEVLLDDMLTKAGKKPLSCREWDDSV